MSLRVHFYRLTFGAYTDEFRSLLDPKIIVTEGQEIPQKPNFDIWSIPLPNRNGLKPVPTSRR